jgi:hypothetical protein
VSRRLRLWLERNARRLTPLELAKCAAGILYDRDLDGRRVGPLYLRTYDDFSRMGYGIGWRVGWLWVDDP